MAARDLTRGPIGAQLAALAVPTGVALALQSLYILVDMAWVAGLGTAAVAALAIGVQAYVLAFALGQILGTTTLAEVSQHAGAGRPEHARRALNTALAAGLGLGMLLSLSFASCAEPIARLFSGDPEVIAASVVYLRVSAPVMVTQTLSLILGSGFRAAGDALTPMVALSATVALNLVLDPLFIYGFELGIAGAAWATVVAQFVALVIYGLRMAKGGMLGFARPELSWAYLRLAAARGLPAGMQFLLFSLTVVVLLAAVRESGPAWTAGVGSGMRILQQAFVPMIALGLASASIAGQSAGAGDPARVHEAWRRGTQVALVLALALLVLLYLSIDLLGPHFAPGAEAESARFHRITAPSLLGFAPAVVSTFVLQALRRPLWPMGAAALRFSLLLLAVGAVGASGEASPEQVLWIYTLTCWIEGLSSLGLYRCSLGSPARGSGRSS